jgi:hypothetical protein
MKRRNESREIEMLSKEHSGNNKEERKLEIKKGRK